MDPRTINCLLLRHPDKNNMRADAQAQPNIALIKYWGKRDIEKNLPAVSSLSITLDSLWTRMSVEFSDTTCAGIKTGME